MSRRENPKVALADGEFELAKEEARLAGKPSTVTVESITRKFGLKKHQLKNYRANHYSPKRKR